MLPRDDDTTMRTYCNTVTRWLLFKNEKKNLFGEDAEKMETSRNAEEHVELCGCYRKQTGSYQKVKQGIAWILSSAVPRNMENTINRRLNT